MYAKLVKRLLDITLSLMALILLSPLFLLLFLLIRIIQGKPVLFSQKRPGLNGHPFTLYKFSTMKNSVDHDGILLPDAERLTQLGKFLRKTSLDELPELVNVLKGEMSLVGPRPLLVEYLKHYSKEQHHRHDVRPGITGLAQVYGRNRLSWDEKFKLDVQYVNQMSFKLDFKILMRTLFVVFRSEGINAKNHATMPKFGNDAL